MRSQTLQVIDALYGEVRFPASIADLIRRPIVQRLRHVRLSNIDSLDMPGIAGISRYEHALGTAYLSTRVGFAAALNEWDFISLQAAALIHDSAITPFGHLVEEALQYVGSDFNHEAKWALLCSDPTSVKELGGIDTQIYLGRASGLNEWATKIFGGNGPRLLDIIVNTIQGQGRFGPTIAGALDLDNLDNLTRIAFHMGLRPNTNLPLALAEKMARVDDEGKVCFEDTAVSEGKDWIEMRQAVYERLMPAPVDFCGKLMLLFATVEALRSGVLGQTACWRLTDFEFLHHLRTCNVANVRETVERWLTADLWDSTELIWFRGHIPRLSELMEFADELSAQLGRRCFAYRIKDKRNRQITMNLVSGSRTTVGQNSDVWLFGLASPTRRAFSSDEQRRITQEVENHFAVSCVAAHGIEAVLF